MNTGIKKVLIGIALGIAASAGINAIAQSFSMPQQFGANNNAPQVIYSSTSASPRTGDQVKQGFFGATAANIDSALSNQIATAAIPTPTGISFRTPGIASVGATLAGHMGVTNLVATQGATQQVCVTVDGTMGYCQIAPPPPAQPTVTLLSNGQDVAAVNMATPGNLTLSWTSSNATVCSSAFAGTSGPSGSSNQNITQTATFTVTCYQGPGLAGLSASDSVTVTLAPQVTVSVQVKDNANTTPQSGGITITDADAFVTWTSTNAGVCVFNTGANPDWQTGSPGGPQSPGNGQQVAPPAGSTTYWVRCYAGNNPFPPAGTAYAQGNVVVTRNLPASVNLTYDGATVDQSINPSSARLFMFNDGAVTLRYSANSVSSCTATSTGAPANSWTTQILVQPTGGIIPLTNRNITGITSANSTYTITCVPQAGGANVSATVSIIVNQPQINAGATPTAAEVQVYSEPWPMNGNYSLYDPIRYNQPGYAGRQCSSYGAQGINPASFRAQRMNILNTDASVTGATYAWTVTSMSGYSARMGVTGPAGTRRCPTNPAVNTLTNGCAQTLTGPSVVATTANPVLIFFAPIVPQQGGGVQYYTNDYGVQLTITKNGQTRTAQSTVSAQSCLLGN